MSERVQTAFGVAGLGMPGLIWASDQLHMTAPYWLAVSVWIVSAGCLLVWAGLWGHVLFQRMGLPALSRHIPLHVAARRAYEAVEKDGIVDLTGSPESKLNQFKFLFMEDPETDVFGVKPPSTKPRLIPKADLRSRHDLYPADGDISQLDDIVSHNAVYVDVSVRRKDLPRVINDYIAKVKQIIGK
jgi:hypothetical protein